MGYVPLKCKLGRMNTEKKYNIYEGKGRTNIVVYVDVILAYQDLPNSCLQHLTVEDLDTKTS